MVESMRKILFQGAFDLLHWGQIRAVQKAKSYGDYLIVAVNTDKLYEKYKDKMPVIPYKYRKKMIEALKCVDEVIPAPDFSPLKLLKKHKIDVYIICKEWEKTKKIEMDYMQKTGGKTIVVPYLKTISTSDIRTKLLANYAFHNIKLCPTCHRKL